MTTPMHKRTPIPAAHGTLDRAEEAARTALHLLGRETADVDALFTASGLQVDVRNVPGVRIPLRVVLSWRELAARTWRDTLMARITNRPAL